MNIILFNENKGSVGKTDIQPGHAKEREKKVKEKTNKNHNQEFSLRNKASK